MPSSRRFALAFHLAAASCFSPNEPVAGEPQATQTTSSGSTGVGDTTTAGVPPGESSGGSGSSTTSSETSAATSDGSSSSGETGETGSSTGAPACDRLDDPCPDGTLCDGSDCVEPPNGMVAVPGGPFMMGCNDLLDTDCGDDEYPYHEVTLSSFAIDQTEVTADAFAECVEAGECEAPTTQTAFDSIDCFPTSGDYPVVCVDWFQARDYCEWRGFRLPTEAEWEKAARGSDGRVYPWGNDAPTCAHAHYNPCPGDDSSIPVGSKPAGASPYGALDMAGNVFEWVGDWYSAAYYVNSPEVDPPGPGAGARHALRSGAFFYYGPAGRTSFRAPNYDTPTDGDANSDVGFRCAVSP